MDNQEQIISIDKRLKFLEDLHLTGMVALVGIVGYLVIKNYANR